MGVWFAGSGICREGLEFVIRTYALGFVDGGPVPWGLGLKCLGFRVIQGRGLRVHLLEVPKP